MSAITASGEEQLLQQQLLRGQTLLQTARDDTDRLQAYLIIGDANHHLAEYNQAEMAFDQAERLARGRHQPKWLAEALIGKVRVAGGQSRYADVLKLAREALVLARQAKDPSTLAKALHWLGNTEFYLGNNSTARGILEEAIGVIKTVGDPLRLATTMTLLGRLEGQTGRQARRIELLEEALAINQELGYQKGIAMCLTGLSWSKLLDGQYLEAEELSAQCLILLRQDGAKWAIANTLLNLAHAQIAQGKLTTAKQHLLESLNIATQINAPNLQLEILVGAARTQTNTAMARKWVQIAIMHPNSTAELRNFAATDIERLEVALKSVSEAALKNILPEVKTQLEA